MKIEIFKGRDKKWRYRAVAANGEIMCTSQAYKGGKGAAKRGATSLLRGIKNKCTIVIPKLLLCGVLLGLTGCVPVLVAGIGAVGTVVAAKKKYEGDVVKAEKIEAYGEAAMESLEEIKDKIKVINE
ncbi:MAG: DUF1508 domain-containing protein [Flavobacteriales bacterium]|jgi:uncharacterized protein YegP (UPF0339 family)|nr:DUF1508 domain-containing protein [Flavobacteriales bacterium]|tara:strand:- start:321 stop:701 length:381 start_codon:yes stop_codon:yes gene_type:complete